MRSHGDERRKADKDIARLGSFNRGEKRRAEQDVETKEGKRSLKAGRLPKAPSSQKAEGDVKDI